MEGGERYGRKDMDGQSGLRGRSNRRTTTTGLRTSLPSYAGCAKWRNGLEVLNQTGKNLVTGNDFSENINSPGCTPSATTGSTHIEKNLGVDLN